ncbi:hypothetical protein KMS_R19040 [Pseudomonas sp. LRP2-20]|uniref:hypothetical protein n=1 Tax=Pseudomonas sp. LRP2-20 TaxID=2944234 RepID=UPI00218B4C9E|nr:hypothetical protein [Pseudomonas sp. LRP2-20]BDM22146.1 hypothetical protein KMS_R19040 [Pseudomonas sp. LRP2-20]
MKLSMDFVFVDPLKGINRLKVNSNHWITIFVDPQNENGVFEGLLIASRDSASVVKGH